ncbi:MAG: DinB family protein [bacterium]
MTRIETLLAEFEHEARTTRKHLARLSDDQFDWRPHARSYTTGELASHLVDCIRWTAPIFSADELDIDPASYKRYSAASSAALLDTFDGEVARGMQAIARASDSNATQPWRLQMRGKVWFEKPREAAFRDMTLNHLVHHRGQLSVYLRLLDIPVPGSYGPTADEAWG